MSITQVFRCSFWMGLLGAGTPKRTLVWSNDPFIRALDLGKMAMGSKKKSTSRNLTALCIDWHKKHCYHNAIQNLVASCGLLNMLYYKIILLYNN